MKYVLLAVFSLLTIACTDRYRYPCQDPENWENKICKKPFCSANGTCPADLSHYDKSKKPSEPAKEEIKDSKGVCK